MKTVVLGRSLAMAVVSSRLASSTTMTLSTISWAMTSSKVWTRVLAALYAGITTTIFLPRNIGGCYRS